MFKNLLIVPLCILASIVTGCSTSGGTAPPPGAGAATVPDRSKAGPDPNLNSAQNQAYKSMADSRALMDEHYRQQPMAPHK